MGWGTPKQLIPGVQGGVSRGQTPPRLWLFSAAPRDTFPPMVRGRTGVRPYPAAPREPLPPMAKGRTGVRPYPLNIPMSTRRSTTPLITNVTAHAAACGHAP